MFEIFNPGEQLVPIKVWLPSPEHLDEVCMRQAYNLSNLPFAFRHIALMPDTHAGYGMPIGGVLAVQDVVVPNAVGVDIGCGICFIHTDVPAYILRDVSAPKISLAEYIVKRIMQQVPQGFEHHKTPQKSSMIDSLIKQQAPDNPTRLYSYGHQKLPQLEEAYYQIGTLGGGNHFIELQEDEDGLLGIMVHTGSRNFGYKVANYFNNLAKSMNKKMKSLVPREYDLAYLPADTVEAQGYIGWMNLASDFARSNRTLIMERVQNIVFNAIRQFTGIKRISITMEVNAHHNYAAFEEHFGRKLWIHRKGAIRAKKGELGIIPGAMGGYSYIVEGLGNPESFNSSSHGAGRIMGRREAVRQFSLDEVMEDFQEKDIVLGKRRKRDTAEEYYKAYKDIDEVMHQQLDLVKPVLKLKTIAVVKG